MALSPSLSLSQIQHTAWTELQPGRPEAAAESLDAALQMGDQAIGEGREAVENLRSSTFEEGDLATVLGALGAELGVGMEPQATPAYRVMVEGKRAGA